MKYSITAITLFLVHSLSGFASASDCAQLFEATKGRYLLQRPVYFHDRVITLAAENSDSETVLAAYLDILDYATVKDATLITVMETMSFAESIDHVLFKQI